MRSCRGQGKRDGLKKRVLLKVRHGVQEDVWPLGETQKDKGSSGLCIRRSRKRCGPCGFLKLWWACLVGPGDCCSVFLCKRGPKRSSIGRSGNICRFGVT